VDLQWRTHGLQSIPDVLVVSTKQSCSKTELKRCTTTEIRWNKNEDARTSPVAYTHSPAVQHAQQLKALIALWDFPATGTNSPCHYYYYFLDLDFNLILLPSVV